MPQFYDAFISYGRADSKDFATKLYQRLQEKGYEVWFDQNDIPLGVDYQQEIDDGLERSHNFIFVMSPHSVNSEYCGLEVKRAVARHKRIIPLLHVDELKRETWQQRNPHGTDTDWANYQAEKRHFGDVRNPRIDPVIGKLNWIYGREEQDDVEAAFQGLVSIIERHKDYVHQHTDLLMQALHWETQQRRSQFLLVGKARENAEAWLKQRPTDEQLPCTPTPLHGEYISESIKNANNMMTQVFLAYGNEDLLAMEKIRRSLWLEGITVWTNVTDIQTGEAFKEAIDRGIEQADNVVYLLSPKAIASTYCQHELDYALSLQKRVIPILVEPTPLDSQPPKLREVQYIDLTDNEREEDYLLDESQLLRILRTDEGYYQTHKILLAQAIKWDRQHRNPSILLRGYNLQQTETWLKTAKTRSLHALTQLQAEFIEESLKQPPADALDVFVSYSRSDSDFARKLNDNLQIYGKLTWFDQESIATASANFQEEIYHGIKVSDNFLFILSPQSVNSPYCADEVEYAASLNKRFITVLHQPVDPATLHPELARVQWLDFSQKDEEFWDSFNQLVRVLETDREYVRNHTKWSQMAIEWQEKNRSQDLLLRGSEFAIANNWLQAAHSEQKTPVPTPLQELFLKESQTAITAGIRREKRQKVVLRSLLGVMTTVAIAAIASTAWAIKNQRQTLQGEVNLLVAFSEAQNITNREFESLLLGLKAVQLLKQNPNLPKYDYLRNKVIHSLRQSVYGVRERNRLNHDNARRVIFSPDGQMIASGGEDGKVKLWTREGEEIIVFEHGDVVRSLSFSPDSQIIASGGGDGDGKVKLWTREGEEITTFNHGDVVTITSLSFSPDSQAIASAGRDGKVKLWTKEGEEIATFNHGSSVSSMSFSPDGQAIATAGDGGNVTLWTREGAEITTFNHDSFVNSVSFSPDGQAIATAGDDGKVKLWTRAGEEIIAFEHGSYVYSVSFSPDGQAIASVGGDGKVKLWTREGKEITTFEHGSLVRSVSFSPDGQEIASAGSDGNVKLWAMEGAEIIAFEHGSELNNLSFSPDGQAIASASFDGKITLWTREGEEITTFNHGSDVLFSIGFSPDSQIIASGGGDGKVKLWTKEGEEITTFNHGDIVTSLSFSPDGQAIASAGEDGKVKLWTREGKEITTFDHGDIVTSLSFSPNGQAIASGGRDGKVKLWTKEGQEITTFEHGSDLLFSVSFSPDGQAIASGGRDGKVKLWTKEGKEITTFNHGSSVSSISFSPDGQVIVSASYDGKVKLWTREGEEITTFDYGSDVSNMSFSPDGKMLISGGGDNGEIKLWNLDLDDLLKRSCTWLRDYLISHPRELQTIEICQTPDLLAQSARSLVHEGDQSAEKGDLKQAIQAYRLALRWNSDLDLQPRQRAKELTPQAIAENND